MYFTQVLVVRILGLSSAGMYQASTALASVYVGFILDAMGRDFYPRLTAIAEDNSACASLVNKQIELGLLLATPGILATMTFAGIVISIFYSAKFLPAYNLLRWQMLGIGLRVACFPMGYMLLAKGNGRAYFLTEFVSNCVNVGLVWFGINYFGLTGSGMAFFALYVFYWLLISRVVKHYYGFKWTRVNIRFGIIFAIATGIVFITPSSLSDISSLVINIGVTLLIVLYSAKTLYTIVGPKIVSNHLLRLRTFFSFHK